LDLWSSPKYSLRAKAELEDELMQRAIGAAPVAIIAALWTIYRAFDTKVFANMIQVLGVAILVVSLSRYVNKALLQKNRISLESAIRNMRYNFLATGFLWTFAIMLSLVELRFRNPSANIATVAIIIGFSMTAVSTIASNLRFIVLFQTAIFLPPTAFLYYLGIMESNEPALTGAVVLTMSYFFIHNQNQIKFNQVIKRVQSSVDMEFANKLLHESQAQLIEEKAKLQHSTRLAAIGEISGEIAHEINNPLALVLGYIELGSDQLKQSVDNRDVVIGKLEKATKAISRIGKIIKGLRQYSRSTLDESPSVTLLSEIMDDVMDFCSEKFNHHSIVLETELDQDCQISCRFVEISQVLLNIISNAIDELVKLPTAERKIFIKSKIRNGTVKISIANSGPKINPAIQSRLFEPFFSTKKVGIGTGLGLSISKNIIEAHAGKLYYDDRAPMTTFVVELPTVE
jgi:signal transduction histidine kinase